MIAEQDHSSRRDSPVEICALAPAASGETLARLLGVDKTTLSKWENNQIPIGANSDRLIRAVALALGPESKADIEKAIRGFTEISDERESVLLELDVKDFTVHYA